MDRYANKKEARKKASIIAAESLNTYLGVHSLSATESISEDEAFGQLENCAYRQLKDYLISSIVDLLLDGKIFFTQSGEAAYNELTQLLSDESVKAEVVRRLDKVFANAACALANDPMMTEEENSDKKARYRYYTLSKRAHSLEMELAELKAQLDEIGAPIEQRCPGQLAILSFDVDDEEED